MPNSQKFVTGGLSSSDIDLILDMHNTLRRQVAPIASNMQKVYNRNYFKIFNNFEESYKINKFQLNIIIKQI